MGGPGSGGARKNTGGARKGAGRARLASKLSDETKIGMVNALKRKAKETGKTWQALAAERMYNPDTPANAFTGLCRLVSDMLGVKESHQVQEVVTYEPVILPALREDPTKLEEWRGEAH